MDLLLLCVIAVPLIALAVRWLAKRSRSLAPPSVSGWLPWVGCAVSFGKAPLEFIAKTKEQLGNVFTIHAAGRYMVFLMDPDDLSIFLQSEKLDFQKAVQPFTSKAAGLPAQSFASSHRALHDMVKGKLASGKLGHLANETFKLFEEKLHFYVKRYSTDQGSGTGVSLHNLVQSVMFHAGVESLFGRECISNSKDIDYFRRTFEKYDLDFEYGAELPSVFLPKWASCKSWLLHLLKGVIDRKVLPAEMTPTNTLLEDLMLNVDKSCAHNYALLLLWATQANALPAVFWTLAFLHEPQNRACLLRARTEADSVLKEKDASVIGEDDLKRMPYILWCVLEGIRLRSPGMITRLAVEDLQVKGFTVQKGSYVMVSPYWLHRNEKNFPNSGSFSPERWQSSDIAKNRFLPGFVAFGGGRYQCPGRWFAMMEMQLIVSLVIRNYDLELLHGVPDPTPLHLVGTQQPASQCDVKICKRV